MSKNPFKDLKKKIKNTTKTIETGFNEKVKAPIKEEVDKVTIQVNPLAAQTNREITKAANTVKHEITHFANQANAAIVEATNTVIKPIDQGTNKLLGQAAPIIDRIEQQFTETAKTVNNPQLKKNNRAQAITAIFKKPKKSTGTKTKTPLIKTVTNKSSAKVTPKQEELSNIFPAKSTTPITPPESKGISGKTLGVMVAGGVALGLGGAFFGEFSSLAGLTMNMVGGVIAGAISGGLAAVATEVMGGSPKIEKAVDNAQKTAIEYGKNILKSKAVQKAKVALIKAGLKLAKDELNNPKTQKAIKTEIVQAVKKELLTRPTAKIKATAEDIGKLFYTKKSSTRSKKTTTKQTETRTR